MSHIEAVCATKPALQYDNSDTAEVKATECTNDIFSASNAADNAIPYKTSFFSKWEYDPEVGDLMPKKSIFSKIGDFFSGIADGIKSFFEKLFGGKKTEKTDNTNETNGTENPDNTDNALETDTPDENEWGNLEGGNLPDKSKLDFNVPDDVKQELKDKFNLNFQYDDYNDSVKFFYDTDGELVVLMPTNPFKSVDYYRQFGEIRYECRNEKIFSDVIGIAVNVEPTWETSDENLETRDGAIGDTKQGRIGDCWLLSGVNALSYTEEGRKIIKDALEYHDGYTTVHLKGAIDYDITDEEVEKARCCRELSTGDDDMLILELAVEKAYKDVADRNIMLDSEQFDEEISEDEDGINGSYEANLIYLITGKESYEGYSPTQTDWWNETFLQNLEFFKEHDNKDVAMTLGASEETTIQDINGNTVEIEAPHGYAVKNADENNLTFTNPHDSSVEITIPKDTASSAFSHYGIYDLTNAEQHKGAKKCTTDENGDKIFKYDEPGEEFVQMDSGFWEPLKYSKKDIRYSKDGEYISTIYYDEAGNQIHIEENDENGAD